MSTGTRTPYYAQTTTPQVEESGVMEEQAVLPPSMYQVVLLNDDFTPMDFVVYVLTEVFGKSEAAAEQIMWQVHHQGRGICGVFIFDIAKTKAQEALDHAQAAGHPLQCVVEKI